MITITFGAKLERAGTSSRSQVGTGTAGGKALSLSQSPRSCPLHLILAPNSLSNVIEELGSNTVSALSFSFMFQNIHLSAHLNLAP